MATEISADDLRYLLALARTGRLITAAAVLGVDHTTVKRRVDRLEKALGGRLIQRGADAWELTDLGSAVTEHARRIEEAVDAAMAVAHEPLEGLRGTVRVLAPDGFGTTFAVPALVKVRDQHPALDIELVTATRPLGVNAAGFDLAITIGIPRNRRLTQEPLADYSLYFYASRGYLHERAPIRQVSDLAGHPLIFYVDSLLTIGDLDLSPAITRRAPHLSSTNVMAQVEATRLGAGVGLLPAFLAAGIPELCPVLAGEVEYRLTFSVVTRPEGAALPAVIAIRQALHAEVEARASELVP